MKNGNQWERVQGPNLKDTTVEFNRNTGTLSDPTFLRACDLAEIKPTRRQASKYSRGLGKAYSHR